MLNSNKRIFITVILALMMAPQVFGHAFSTSYSRITPRESRLEVQFTLNLADFHCDNLAEAIEANYRIEAPEAPLRIETLHSEPIASNVVLLDLLYTFKQPPTTIQITSTLERITQADHSHIVQVGEGDDTREAVLDAKNPVAQVSLEDKSLFATVNDFVRLGIEHIFTGYDHLAFLAGLLMMTTTLRAVFKVVTSFTLAHSITLALATFNLVSVPSRLIESLIPLSIAYIAIENYTCKTLLGRWKVTFLFGLIHGFGFSNVLKQMALTRRTLAISLFSFNGGVELGQLAFVSLVFPLIYLVIRSRWKHQFLTAASIAIGGLGFFWFVQRMIG
jgi:HupE/UreJ protein